MSSEETDPREEERRRRREEREAYREARREERRWAREQGGGPKERVLHTRVSERLAEDIRTVADELRVPVSNVVRNVLEDVFSVVEAVTDNVGDLLEEVLDEADRARDNLGRRKWKGRKPARAEGGGEPEEETEAAPPRDLPEYPEVLGWQPLLLNAEQACVGCGRSLARGTRAYAGLTASGLSGKFLCVRCASGVVTPAD
jgi:hypothetical protein